MEQSDQDPIAKKSCSEGGHFCPHCKHIVSRSTYYRHQALHFDESQESLQTQFHEDSFEFQDGIAAGTQILAA